MNAQLRRVVEQARKAPFYRETLRGLAKCEGASEWQRVPFTTKDDLRNAYPFGLLAVAQEAVASYHESTGTSGEPTASYFTESDWDDVASRFLRNGIGIGPGDWVLIKTPYALVTTAHQMHRAARSVGATVVPADNRSLNMTYAKVVRLLKDLPITVAWCLPTEVMLWAEAARSLGLDPATDFPKLRAFLVAGEPMSAARRKRLEKLWGSKRIFQDYGSTETGSLAGECVAGAMHLWTDRIDCEVIDQGGQARAFGSGELVVTPLFREAMPLIRYRLADAVTIAATECPCGSRLPTIVVHGRRAAAVPIGACHLQQMDVEEVVYSLPALFGVLFWRARARRDVLEIEVETAHPRDSAVCDELAHEVFVRLGVRAEVVARAVGELYPRELLTQAAPFVKPQYLFHDGESWDRAIHY